MSKSDWFHKFILPGLLFVLVFIVFSNALAVPFFLDDKARIVNNPDIISLTDVVSRLFENYWAGQLGWSNDPSRPLVTLIFAWLMDLGGGSPVPFHAFNIFIHACNTVLLYFLFNKIFQINFRQERGLSFFGALLFAVLPIQAGSVIYAYALSDLLSGFFVFSSLLVYLLEVRSIALKYMCLFVLLLGGLASKQISVVIPLIILSAEYVLSLKWQKHRFRFFGFLACGSLCYLIVRWWYFGTIGDVEAQRILSEVEWKSYIYLEPLAVLKYIGLSLFPFGLTIDHAMGAETYSEIFFLSSWVFVVLGLIIIFKQLILVEKSNKLILFGALFYLILLVPVSSFFPTTDAVVERRVYVANFGFILVILSFLYPLLCKLKRKSIFGFILIFLYVAKTYTRTSAFHDPEYIWKESLELYPKNKRALNNLAIYYSLSGKADLAIAIYEDQIKQNPSSPEPLNNLGMIFGVSTSPLFDPEKAEKYFRQSFAADLSHNFTLPLQNLAIMFITLGKLQEAENVCLQILQYHKMHEFAQLSIISILIKKGNFEKARLHLSKAKLILKPSPQLREIEDILRN